MQVNAGDLWISMKRDNIICLLLETTYFDRDGSTLSDCQSPTFQFYSLPVSDNLCSPSLHLHHKQLYYRRISHVYFSPPFVSFYFVFFVGGSGGGAHGRAPWTRQWLSVHERHIFLAQHDMWTAASANVFFQQYGLMILLVNIKMRDMCAKRWTYFTWTSKGRYKHGYCFHTLVLLHISWFLEAFTDTLPMLCNGFMYGSIYRHFTNVV